MSKSINLSQIMTSDVIVQSGETSIEEAALIMTHTTIGAIVIVDNHNKPAGIFTERDLVTRIIGKKTPKYTQLKDVMSQKIISLKEDDSVLEAARVMVKKSIRHVLVTNLEGTLKGIVSIRDTNKTLLELLMTK